MYGATVLFQIAAVAAWLVGFSDAAAVPRRTTQAISSITSDQLRCAFPSAPDRYPDLVKAVQGTNLANDKEAMAMFLGQIGHESAGLTAVREFCSLPGAPNSCLTHYDGPAWCGAPAPAGKHYYGRGFIQLSWSCNYQAAGQALGLPLLQDPDMVERDITVAWKTTVWYYNSHNCGAGDFASATRCINGALECNGGPGSAKQEGRISTFQKVRQCMGLSAYTGALRC